MDGGFLFGAGINGAFLSDCFEDRHIGILGIFAFLVPMGILYYSQRQYVERTKDSVNELQRMNQELITRESPSRLWRTNPSAKSTTNCF